MLPPTVILDITDLLDNLDSKYIRTGAVYVVLKNGTYFIQYNINAWAHCDSGVSSFGPWMFSGIDVENFKKQIAKGSINLNSPDLDAKRYDGISNLFFQKINF